MARKARNGGSAAKSATAASLAGPKSARDLDAVVEQIDVLKGDVAALVDALGDLVGDTAREGRATVERKAGEYATKGRQQADAAISQAQELEEELRAQIGRNPLTAILVALGLGFLIGLMSRR
ncbi:MAG TPA: hypothetical protein VK844_07125 [Hyphomicrobiales bacterium]|nr:hypothetical protein [Hyphomicrobiales bacterium]